MNQKGMQKIVQKIPEKKRKEIAAALKQCKTQEEAANVIAKYASFIPKSQVKEIFSKIGNMEHIDYSNLQDTADDLLKKINQKK
ncbi:MAG: hypothetical protein IJO13_05075 [Lachnospiraceae bacterium]|nr:hypothetical protein [Lachnospiraceae bacterium]